MLLTRRLLRDRLRQSRLYLIFTPEVALECDPLDALARALPSIDVLQVRVKERDGMSCARELYRWTERVLRLLETEGARDVPVLVNDRVDVASCLQTAGIAGVHIGQDDTPPRVARDVLGPEAIIGLSTHTAREVAAADADEEFIDYLGFGPIYPTSTKGYGRGLGPESAWIVSNATTLPVFPIGGIDALRAVELAPVGRAAVSSAILASEQPERAAEELREQLRAEPGA